MPSTLLPWNVRSGLGASVMLLLSETMQHCLSGHHCGARDRNEGPRFPGDEHLTTDTRGPAMRGYETRAGSVPAARGLSRNSGERGLRLRRGQTLWAWIFQFIASIAVITRDPQNSRELFVDALGLRMDGSQPDAAPSAGGDPAGPYAISDAAAT